MPEINLSAITTDTVSLSILKEKGIAISVLRLDKIHPEVSGNKLFKLKFYLQEAARLGKTRIATFGGAWSNHILATAAACKMAGLSAVGYIRGEQPATLSNTLAEAMKWGMKLEFLSREEYTRQKRALPAADDTTYVISEGGYGLKGAAGAATISALYDPSVYTHICCAAGTGTMTAGLLMEALPHQQVVSISVLKNNLQLANDIQLLSGNKTSAPCIIHDYHFGGYAKHSPELISFMNEFYRQTSIPTDFVYTGKLFYAIQHMAAADFFPPGSKLLVIHSGGLQGNSSLSKGTLIF